ncbi:hypothetical protein [Parenemella sanctibonifatiensis]|uniref:Uncharacterized protein n=1 Tax=Parenemella sanctibonifatiensis TaxID=2016505 RepID=A0A255EC01_9ACTN|nr:hypothetical protein [Parenemella sanctibonifatiensis]OYN88790.1 hypothetical protein CGZ92_03545 [Parenemella sanctibonifatiensis]
MSEPFLWLNAALSILGVVAVGALVVLVALIARGPGSKLAIIGAALLAFAMVLPIGLGFWLSAARASILPLIILPVAVSCIGLVCLVLGLILRSREAA